MKTLVLTLISAYRKYISPLTPPACRFYPTCSAYAYEAIDRFGLWKGMGLALKRCSKCHPFHKEKTVVVDLVPENEKS